MISLRKLLNWPEDVPAVEDQHPLILTDDPPDLPQALKQALHMLLEGILSPAAKAGELTEQRRQIIAGLLHRLEGPLRPFDVLEIATDALAALEEESKVAGRRARQQEERLRAADQQAEMSRASLQALQTVVAGLPLSAGAAEPNGAGRRAMADLSHRLESPLAPFDVLEIAGDVLTALEQDAKAVRDRARLQEEQNHLDAQQALLLPASLQALQMLLAGLPLQSFAPSPEEARARRAMADLESRLKGPLTPQDVLDVANEALIVLEQESKGIQELHSQHQERTADQQSALLDAFASSLRKLLTGLLVYNDASRQPDESLRQVIAGLLHRLDEPFVPGDIAAIADEALSAVQQDAQANRERQRRQEELWQIAGQQDDVSKALLQALQTLLGGLAPPTDAGDSDAAPVMAGLLRRLQGPLAPFDVLEIAGDALTAMEHASKAVQDRYQRQEEQRHLAEQHAQLAGASRQAPQILLSGLPFASVIAGESDVHARRTTSELLRRLQNPVSSAEAVEIAHEAVTSLEDDAKATVNRYRLQSGELQEMITLLTATVAALPAQKNAAFARLQQIDKLIAQTTRLEDLHTLKANLAECLPAIREAIQAQPRPVAEPARPLERSLQPPKARVTAPPRAEPEEPAEKDKAESKAAEYAAVFLLDRENSIASRFGEDVRHKVLRFVQQHLKESLLPGDRLVRWKGAAFVASFKRPGALQDVRAELSSVASIHVPQVIDVGNRSVRLPISLSWAVFPQARFASLDVLFEKVDDFIARAQIPKID